MLNEVAALEPESVWLSLGPCWASLGEACLVAMWPCGPVTNEHYNELEYRTAAAGQESSCPDGNYRYEMWERKR